MYFLRYGSKKIIFSDSIDSALNKYDDHSSISKKKEYFNKPTEFNFWEIMPNNFEKETKKKLDSSKKGIFKNITLKSLKEGTGACRPVSCNILAETIVRKRTFLTDLKSADVTPVFKEDKSLF